MWPPWSRALPLLLLAAFFSFEELVSTPSCRPSPAAGERRPGTGGGHDSEAGKLTVMMLADLMLLGSDASYADTFFRDPFFAKFYAKSIRLLKPDMLIVLGDISAKGWQLNESKWLAVLRQFERMLGPSVGLPMHIVLGDKDIGECSNLNRNFVARIVRYLPGSEPSGCSTFEFGNVSFVSLNGVALLCSNNDLRLSVEKFVEKASVSYRTKEKDLLDGSTCSFEKKEPTCSSPWMENALSLGTGPVLLLHFPLYQSTNVQTSDMAIRGGESLHASFSWYKSIQSESNRVIPLDQTLPANETDYVLQALKPSIIFNAHAHTFNDRIHIDGTREITVPAMTWAKQGKPGFVAVTFVKDGVLDVSYCNLTQESYVIAGYASLLLVVISAAQLSKL